MFSIVDDLSGCYETILIAYVAISDWVRNDQIFNQEARTSSCIWPPTGSFPYNSTYS